MLQTIDWSIPVRVWDIETLNNDDAFKDSESVRANTREIFELMISRGYVSAMWQGPLHGDRLFVWNGPNGTLAHGRLGMQAGGRNGSNLHGQGIAGLGAISNTNLTACGPRCGSERAPPQFAVWCQTASLGRLRVDP